MYGRPQPGQDTGDAIWERVFAVNVDGVFRLTRAVVPAMLAAGRGAIVNVASEAAPRGNAAGVAYTASKHAVVGITKNTAFMYGPQGIRTNAVAPGGVATGMAQPPNASAFGQGRTGPFLRLIPPAGRCSNSGRQHLLEQSAVPDHQLTVVGGEQRLVADHPERVEQPAHHRHREPGPQIGIRSAEPRPHRSDERPLVDLLQSRLDLLLVAAAHQRQIDPADVVVGEQHLDEPLPEPLQRHVQQRLVVDAQVHRLQEQQFLRTEMPDHQRRVTAGERGDVAH
ncbi:SDR family NAD(P)-dependent oxidoreductase [Actinoplanes sp. NEAU-A11]|uniref:SDR family NAD(P)-dependent oxidoreductase n=1 Tax=Actinoplanes aureus TaxID=2792083 RepID=A0A931G1Y1_9ACTN|nr:SDR family NAD(P)-dependent oxidoreductase [Actinoplanes aureus]